MRRILLALCTRRSLLARTFLPTALILVLCVGSIALYTHWRTQQAFQGYVTARQGQVLTNRGRVLAAGVRRVYRREHSWNAVQRLLKDQALADEARLIVIVRGRVVADSSNLAVGQRISPPPDAVVVPLARTALGTLLGRIALIPTNTNPAAQDRFLAGVDSGLIIAGLGGLACALVLAFLNARRLARPLIAITHAAGRMAAGDLGQRVPVGDTATEVETLARTFNQMANSLDEAQRQRRMLIADIAHELRTPLTGIRGYLEAIQDGAIEPTPAVIGSMHEEAMLLSELMRDLQDLALADAGKLSLHLETHDLQPLLDGAVASQAATAAERGIDLRTEPPATPLPSIRADSVRLGQVLRNVIANALLHTPPDGSVVVGAASHDRHVRITVRDTGRGIPPEHLPHIFERFYRADPSRDRNTGGAGIGLSIARGIVLAHAGEIAVDSVVGRGTEFQITLPIDPQDQVTCSIQ